MAEILLTNDDGVHSEGILALARALVSVGEVITVAPDREMSACGQGLTLQRPIRYEEIGPGRFSVEGTPTDCVIVALNHILPKTPDLVVSGINKGPNLGHDIAYSGTVAAAMEAARHGVPAMAVSVVAWENFPFEAAARYAARLAEKVLQDGLPSGVVLNVNVPSKAAQGIRVTRQGPCNVRSLIVEKSDPRGRKYFWLDQQLDPATLPGESDFDYIAVESGFVSLTPLKLDRTDLDAASQLAAWPEALSGEKSV